MDEVEEVMSRDSIQMAYSGAPVDAGLMDVRDLGPALLSIGELCRDVNKIVNGNDSDVVVRVKADFIKGSFKIDLDLAKTLLEKAKNLLTGDGIELDKIIDLIFGGAGVIAVLKLLKGEKDPVTTTIENGKLTIKINGDNNSINVDQNVMPLLRDSRIRKSINGIVRPLNKEGMTAFSVRRGRQTLQTVEKADAKYLMEDSVDVDIESNDGNEFTRTAYLEIIKPSFKKAYKWSFSDGSGPVNAFIEGAQENRTV